MSTEWIAEDAFRLLRERLPDLKSSYDDNEATTRLRIIDVLLFEVLSWDRGQVECEKYCHEGRLDYVFGSGQNYSLVIEAKKDGTHFVLPARSYPVEPVPFALIAKESSDAADAMQQAHAYANQLGARYSAITNGHQWLLSLTFVPNTTVEDRLVYVFESLDAIEKKFRTFFECFSDKAIETNLPSLHLLEMRRAPAPPKLSSHIPRYPLRVDHANVLNGHRAALQIVWDAIHRDANDEAFLRECYITAEASDDMFRVAREFLEQRGAVDDRVLQSQPEHASTRIVASSGVDHEQPIVVLGRIGYGKSTFLKYLRHIGAKELLAKKYIQIDLDFLDRPAAAGEVPDFILDQVESQLKSNYHIEVNSDAVVRLALRKELKEFRTTPRGMLLSQPGKEEELAQAEVEFIESFTKDREKYFARLMSHIRHGQGKSIAIFFDNLDRRTDTIQEQAFLRASAIAAEWCSLVFVCLRPSTVVRSQTRGVLDAIAPRVIVISPPKTVPMLRKRFQYAAKFARRKITPDPFPLFSFSAGIVEVLPLVAELFDMFDQSLFRRPAIAQQYEAVANGNARLIVKYVRDMLCSNHLNTNAILAKIKNDGECILEEHETLGALLFGEYLHFEPKTSLFLNLFDIWRADPSEHFSRLFLLDFLARHADSGQKFGYLALKTVHAYMASLGYSSDHVTATIGVLFDKKCVEGRNTEEATAEIGDELRVSDLGRYHAARLVRKFIYLDAVAVDTPILTPAVRQNIQDVRNLKGRISRSREFLRYLDQSADSVQDADARRIWEDVSTALAHNVTDVEKAAQDKGWD